MQTSHYQIQKKKKNQILTLSEDTECAQSLIREAARLGLHIILNSEYRLEKGEPMSPQYAGIILDLDATTSPHLELIHALHTRNPAMPILVVGEANRKYDIFFALMNGATEFLTKPIDSVLFKRKCLRLFH